MRRRAVPTYATGNLHISIGLRTLGVSGGLLGLLGLLILFVPLLVGRVDARGSFTELATVRNVGYVTAESIGPGPVSGAERLYLSYSYPGQLAELVAVDPDTGKHRVFPFPTGSVDTARAIAVGLDDRIYLGTNGGARLLRFDPRAEAFDDLGRPSPSEGDLWGLAVGNDGCLYGCTIPNGKLIRYNPKTSLMEDLGTLEASQGYAHSIAASQDGFLYVGLGFAPNSQVAAYNIRSGEKRSILPVEYRHLNVEVLSGDNGYVYCRASGNSLQLKGWQVIALSKEFQVPLSNHNRLKTGADVRVVNGEVSVQDSIAGTKTIFPYLYKGAESNVFRLGIGPDGAVYGSTGQPSHFFRLNHGDRQIEYIGELGSGEVYSFLPYEDTLLIAGYATVAPLMIYNPKRSFDLRSGADANPQQVSDPGTHARGNISKSWRPLAMVHGPDSQVFVGSVPPYGNLGGLLTPFEPKNSRVSVSYKPVPDQSISSLCLCDGLIVGGTGTYGGGGATSTATEAKVFVWDPAEAKTVFETIPVPGATNVTNLTTMSNGLVIGMAGPLANEDQLFVLDPKKQAIIHRKRMPFSVNSSVYNSIASGPDGRVYGLYPGGVFSIDPGSLEVKVEAAYSEGVVTAGFSISGRNLYFGSGGKIIQYTIP